MKAQDIHIGDLERILIGNVPGVFYIEVLIRLLVIYLLLIISMRLIGKRMASGLSRNELAAIVVLAAAVGIPMQSPERGILPGLIISFIVVVTSVCIAKLAYKDQRFEKFSQGDITTLITNGTMDLRAMEKARISKERLSAQLRSEGIKHLGVVKRMYWEAGGSFTIVKNDRPQPGLSIIPCTDAELRVAQKEQTGQKVCTTCGKISATGSTDCSNCGNSRWEYPIL